MESLPSGFNPRPVHMLPPAEERTVINMDDPKDQQPDRVSLAGPDPLDVLRAMLKVDPDAPPVAAAERERPANAEPEGNDQ